jgi:hypothetical protein
MPRARRVDACCMVARPRRVCSLYDSYTFEEDGLLGKTYTRITKYARYYYIQVAVCAIISTRLYRRR